MAMGEYRGVGVVARKVKNEYRGVGGVARKIKKAYRGVSGVARQYFAGETPLSSLDVGTIVPVLENGAEADFIIVQKGYPGSTYDASCTGVWLMRAAQYSAGGYVWWGSGEQTYANSNLHKWLNNTYYPLLGDGAKNAIKSVIIPHYFNTVYYTGASGVQAKVFAPAAVEVGKSGSNVPFDGVKLLYFYNNSLPESMSVQTRSPYAVSSANKSGYTLYWQCQSNGASTSPQNSGSYPTPMFIVPENTTLEQLIA